MAKGLKGPRHMVWSDAGESVIVFVQGGPPGMVMKLDLTTTPPSVAELAGPTASIPYSLAIPLPDHVLIGYTDAVGEVYLTSSIYSASGPILLGIGFVPADAAHLPGGYADTTMDPSYFYQVKDAPFGGTLPLMINHDRARTMGARFYKVQIGTPGSTPVEANQAFSDYRWNATLNRFELVTQVPVKGFYPLHATGEIWLNYWLGMLLGTGGQPNGLNTISIRLFGSQSDTSEIGKADDPGRSATLMIDNTLPVAHIDHILHNNKPVKPCELVNSGSHTCSFMITAQAQRHLRGWSLVSYWGENAWQPVASDDYSQHVSSSRLWTGLDHQKVPAAPWDAAMPNDPTSTRCAHTFWLSACDRVINGWGWVHDSVSTTSRSRSGFERAPPRHRAGPGAQAARLGGPAIRRQSVLFRPNIPMKACGPSAEKARPSHGGIGRGR
jgi:hypothetical protein